MILPETAQVGDILGIFSTDGNTYRGSVRVREMFPGPPPQIGFDGPLPIGTTQGDILCLVRRRDEGIEVISGVDNRNLVAPISAYKGAIEAVQQVQAERDILIARNKLLEQGILRARQDIENKDIRLSIYDGQISALLIRIEESNRQVKYLQSQLSSTLGQDKSDGISLPVRRIKSPSK